MNQVLLAAQGRDFKTELREYTEEEWLKSAGLAGYTLFRMQDPFHDRSMTFRQVYLPAFWQIESSGKRWEWRVAKTDFEPETVDTGPAEWFAKYWRNRLFENSPDVTKDGYVFVPLQGRLLQHRSFQTATPIEMIKSTLRYSEGRKVVASLHPHETYSQPEIDALDLLAKQNSRFSWVKGGSDALLPGCDYVVTQNSGTAFKGYFLRKPVLLFGHIDFHHIAAKTWDHGEEEAFRKVTEMLPEYDKYMFWFLRDMSIHAGRDDAQLRILKAFRSGGWKI